MCVLADGICKDIPENLNVVMVEMQIDGVIFGQVLSESSVKHLFICFESIEKKKNPRPVGCYKISFVGK
jgi:hypothetical protein